MNGRDKRRARAERARQAERPAGRHTLTLFPGDGLDPVDLTAMLAGPFDHRRPIPEVERRIEAELRARRQARLEESLAMPVMRPGRSPLEGLFL